VHERRRRTLSSDDLEELIRDDAGRVAGLKKAGAPRCGERARANESTQREVAP